MIPTRTTCAASAFDRTAAGTSDDLRTLNQLQCCPWELLHDYLVDLLRDWVARAAVAAKDSAGLPSPRSWIQAHIFGVGPRHAVCATQPAVRNAHAEIVDVGRPPGRSCGTE